MYAPAECLPASGLRACFSLAAAFLSAARCPTRPGFIRTRQYTPHMDVHVVHTVVVSVAEPYSTGQSAESARLGFFSSGLFFLRCHEAGALLPRLGWPLAGWLALTPRALAYTTLPSDTPLLGGPCTRGTQPSPARPPGLGNFQGQPITEPVGRPRMTPAQTNNNISAAAAAGQPPRNGSPQEQTPPGPAQPRHTNGAGGGGDAPTPCQCSSARSRWHGRLEAMP